jgi:hypothetical protein
MKRPRVRFTVRGMMVAVAIAALVAAIGARIGSSPLATRHPFVLLVAVLVTGSIGILALRHPLVAIPFVLLVLFLTPAYAHVGLFTHTDLPCLGAATAWLIGAPAGWCFRRLRKADPQTLDLAYPKSCKA